MNQISKWNISKWVVLNEKIRMWAFLLQNNCVKHVSTMSRILRSECIINMPDVVLYHTTLLKSISVRMLEIFFLGLKDRFYLRFYNFSV